MIERSARAREGDATVGMAVFLGGWAMMFAALFFTYGAVRAQAPAWPPAGDPRLPIAWPAVNTLVLLASSVVLRRRRGPAIALGVVFCALQALMWRGLWTAGLTPKTDTYGSVFYMLTGFHALHVIVGLVGLALARPGTSLRMWSIFWHFVGAVWGVLFVAVFLR